MTEPVPPSRLRREPPRFRLVSVVGVKPVTPRLVRVTLGGPELDGFVVDEPAASVRVLLPTPGERNLEMPAWNGNEFLLADGRRPIIRTFTPLRADPEHHDLDVEVVVHEGGAASAWALAAEPGARAAVSGPGRGYSIDAGANAYLIAGDETAIPAIGQLLEAMPVSMPVDVYIEVADPSARIAVLPAAWVDLAAGSPPGDALVNAVRDAPIGPGTRVWAAGEAAAVQRIRRHLFDERGLPRSQAAVRGYWKHGRAGDGE